MKEAIRNMYSRNDKKNIYSKTRVSILKCFQKVTMNLITTFYNPYIFFIKSS